MRRENPVRTCLKKLNHWICLLDRASLWWTGLLFLAITFLPYLVLGEGSVFEIHDQLDETIMTYVLNARHLFERGEIFPELLGGVNKSGMQPSAIFFIPLYRICSPFWAFLLQCLIVRAAGYFGMYGSVRKLTGSSILSVAAAGCFALLPIQPVYGLSVLGVPLLLYAFLCLWKGECRAGSMLLILLFGLTTHLVLIGYVVLSFWGLAILWQFAQFFCRKHRDRCAAKDKREDSDKATAKPLLNWWPAVGCAFLTVIYIVVNHRLFLELIFGGGSYVSHREEHVNPVEVKSVLEQSLDVFLHSFQHANSYHLYLILPIFVLLIGGWIFYRRLSARGRESLFLATGVLALLIAVALFFGICKSEPVIQWKNGQTGMLRYFQLERYYWLYPALWFLEFALACRVWWDEHGKKYLMVWNTVALAVILLPTLQYMKPHTYFYKNVNQYNNGSGITGYVTWEAYYAEDLMEQIEGVIGEDITDYRVAHLGISPAPSLMHGFYTVDGYSNNYPLEYKHRFREVIGKELEKNEATRLYFDQWGSRCYLFNGTSGTYWNMGKHEKVVYEELEFDMKALRGLDCNYLFSGGEILCAEELGLELVGYYETESSYWGIWLYRLTEEGV